MQKNKQQYPEIRKKTKKWIPSSIFMERRIVSNFLRFLSAFFLSIYDSFGFWNSYELSKLTSLNVLTIDSFDKFTHIPSLWMFCNVFNLESFDFILFSIRLIVFFNFSTCGMRCIRSSCVHNVSICSSDSSTSLVIRLSTSILLIKHEDLSQID